MRAVDQLMFQYAEQEPACRRWNLATITDAAIDADVMPRVAFLSERAAHESGVLAHQALAGYLALLPARRLAGWASGASGLAAVPVLDARQVAWSNELPPPTQVALALAATPGLEAQLAGLLDQVADPFPLAMGLARRSRSHFRVLGFVTERCREQPTLALILDEMFGKYVGRTVQQLAAGAAPELAVSLARGLPRHPERDWTRAFRALVATGDRWAKMHAMAALARIATPQASASLLEMEKDCDHPAAREQFLRACGAIGGTAALERVVAALEDAEPALLAVALDVLVTGGALDERLDRAADRLHTSPDERVRALALAVLIRAGVKGKWKLLDEMTRSQTAAERVAGATAMGHLADGRAQQRLEEIARGDASRTVTAAALRCLTRSRGGLAVRTFREAIARGGAVELAATEVLLWRAQRTPGEVLEVFDRDGYVGPALVALGVAIAATGAREGLGRLARALTSPDPGAAAWAVEALFPLGKAIPVRLLGPAVKSAHPELRARGALALALAGDARGVMLMQALCGDAASVVAGARALIDLAAILPAVRGWPLFEDAGRLIPQDTLPAGAPRDPIATLDIATPAWTAAPASDAQRWDPALGGTAAVPSLEGEVPRGTPPPAPAPPPAPPPSPSLPPPLAPVAARVLSKPVPAPPRPTGKAPATAADELSGQRYLIAAAVALGLLVAVFPLSAAKASRARTKEAARALNGEFADPGFGPFAALGGSLKRGILTREFRLSDALKPGDRVSTSPSGALMLRSALGSRVFLGSDSQLTARGAQPSGLARDTTAYGFESPAGRVELEWREPFPFRLATKGGVLEGRTTAVKLDRGHLDVRSGPVRWTPTSGDPVELSTGGTLDLP